MSNDKNNLVYREQLDDNVIEMLSEDIGSNYSLRTENTKTIVAALNEILGKDIICNAIGSPLLTTDTFAQMGEKIHVMVNDFKAKLMSLGVSVSSIDKLASLIEKVGEIDLGVDAEELLNPYIESLREILSDEGLELSGEETLAELIVKVDEEFDTKKNIMSDYTNTLKQILINKNVEDIENENDLLVLINKVDLLTELVVKIYLYKNGEEYEDITGGWDAGYTGGGTFNKYENKMTVSTPYSSATNYGSCDTNSNVDLSLYSKLYFKIYITSPYSAIRCGVTSTPNSYNYVRKVDINKSSGISAGIRTIEVDVSDINNGYVFMQGVSTIDLGGTIAFDILEIWLEE